MNLESIIQSEANQKERNNCNILNAYIWNLEKQYWWTYVQGRNRRRLVDTAGEEDRGTNWGSSTETYTLPYAEQTARGKLLGDTGAQRGYEVLCDDLEDGDVQGEGGSRGRGPVYT